MEASYATPQELCDICVASLDKVLHPEQDGTGEEDKKEQDQRKEQEDVNETKVKEEEEEKM